MRAIATSHLECAASTPLFFARMAGSYKLSGFARMAGSYKLSGGLLRLN